jgi:hypothetical protein
MNTSMVNVYNIVTGKFETIPSNVYNMFRETMYVLYLM